MPNRLPAYAFAGLLLVGGAGAMAQAEAERRLDAAIERLRAALGPEARIVIGTRRVDPLTGRATLGDVVLTMGPNRLTIPSLDLAEVSETRIGRAEAAGARFADATSSGSVGRVLVAGLPLPVPGKAFDVAGLAFEALEIEAVRMEEPGRRSLRLDRLAVSEWRPGGVGGGRIEGFAFEESGPDPIRARLDRAEVAALSLPLTGGDFDPLAFRAERIAIENAGLHDSRQGVTIALGQVSLENWVPGRLTLAAAERLEVTAPAGGHGTIEARLARFSMSGIDGSRYLAAALNGLQVPDPIAGEPQRASLEGLEARWDGQPVLSLARLASQADFANGVLTGVLSAEGFRLVPPRGQADWLVGLGYREVAGALEMRASAPRAGGRLEIAPFRIAWEQAGTLSLTAQVDDVPGTPAEGAAVDPTALAAQYADSRLAQLTLTWREQGLLGRFLTQQARQQRMPEARLREQWAQMALGMPIPGQAPPGRQGPQGRGQPAGKGGEPDVFTPIREALAAFIRQPGTLEVTLRPPKPLSFSAMPGFAGEPPVEIVQRLGLSVVAR